jgi:hypothetical protein
MKTANSTGFKAVEFMRQVRSEVSELYQKDKHQFHQELAQAMKAFLANRKKATDDSKRIQTKA